MPFKTRADLSMAYTPGVARICDAIAKEPEKVFKLTIKKDTCRDRNGRNSSTRPW